MKLSVIILCAGRQKLLERCVSSVLAALPEGAELKIIVNGDHPENVTWLSQHRGALSWIQVPKVSRCIARNNALSECTGDIVYFLDDDVEIPLHLFDLALETFRNDPNLAILGGPNLTPPSSSFQERIFGAVVASPFCAPKVWKRYAASHSDIVEVADQHELILCNFVVRRSLVWPRLRFLPNLTSNEENIFVFEGQRMDLKICRLNSLYVYHCRRPSLLSFLRQIKSYGTGRGEQIVLFPSSIHFGFYFGLLFPFLAFPVGFFAPQFLIAPITLYFTGAVAGALTSPECRKLGPVGATAVTFLTPAVHATYFFSIWKVLVRWAASAITTRVISPIPQST